jgi:hypothetical protein
MYNTHRELQRDIRLIEVLQIHFLGFVYSNKNLTHKYYPILSVMYSDR